MEAVCMNATRLCVSSTAVKSLKSSSFYGKAFVNLGAKQVAHQSRRVTSAVAVTSEVTTDDKVSQKNTESSPYRTSEVDSAEVKDFNAATVTAVEDVAQDARKVTLDIEISREFVPLDKAYTKPGQALKVRLANGTTTEAYACSPPFPSQANWAVLYKLRGDITSGATKAPQYSLSVRGPVELFVPKSSPLYDVQPGTALEAGAFSSSGMDLRPILFLSRYPTVLLFAAGPGIAALRSLVEATDMGSLSLDLRADVRVYYSAPTPAELAFQDRFASWSTNNTKVLPVVASGDASWQGLVGSFASAFDADDLEYDPDITAAVVCGDKRSNAEALQVLEEAGVPRQSIVVWEA